MQISFRRSKGEREARQERKAALSLSLSPGVLPALVFLALSLSLPLSPSHHDNVARAPGCAPGRSRRAGEWGEESIPCSFSPNQSMGMLSLSLSIARPSKSVSPRVLSVALSFLALLLAEASEVATPVSLAQKREREKQQTKGKQRAVSLRPIDPIVCRFAVVLITSKPLFSGRGGKKNNKKNRLTASSAARPPASSGERPGTAAAPE